MKITFLHGKSIQIKMCNLHFLHFFIISFIPQKRSSLCRMGRPVIRVDIPKLQELLGNNHNILYIQYILGGRGFQNFDFTQLTLRHLLGKIPSSSDLVSESSVFLKLQLPSSLFFYTRCIFSMI